MVLNSQQAPQKDSPVKIDRVTLNVEQSLNAVSRQSPHAMVYSSPTKQRSFHQLTDPMEHRARSHRTVPPKPDAPASKQDSESVSSTTASAADERRARPPPASAPSVVQPASTTVIQVGTHTELPPPPQQQQQQPQQQQQQEEEETTAAEHGEQQALTIKLQETIIQYLTKHVAELRAGTAVAAATTSSTTSTNSSNSSTGSEADCVQQMQDIQRQALAQFQEQFEQAQLKMQEVNDAMRLVQQRQKQVEDQARANEKERSTVENLKRQCLRAMKRLDEEKASMLDRMQCNEEQVMKERVEMSRQNRLQMHELENRLQEQDSQIASLTEMNDDLNRRNHTLEEENLSFQLIIQESMHK